MAGARVDLRRRLVACGGRDVRVRVYPIGLDVAGARAGGRAAGGASRRSGASRQWRGDAKLLLRVDRAELAKNILRGFLAFDRFLERNRAWRGRVRFLALLNPSREEHPASTPRTCASARRRPRRSTRGGAAPAWTPVDARVRDEYAETLASYRLYDALLVNPTLDGMNLVAKEGPMLNRNDGRGDPLARRPARTRSWAGGCCRVDPFDLDETAGGDRRALEMPAAERAARRRGLRAAIRRNPPERWVRAQLRDLGAT